MNQDWLQQNIWPRFSEVLKKDGIYLANHSLGRPPDRAKHDVAEALNVWYEQLDGAWDYWMREMETFRDNIRALTGADYVVPKTSAGQGLRAVLNALEPPVNIVTTAGEFDSLDFILRVYEQRGRAVVRWVDPSQNNLFDTADILHAIVPETDLVVVSVVMYATGQVIDGLSEIAAKARSCGARLLLDAYHAVGVLPLAWQEIDADFVVGGSYKYLRGGPGAAYLGMRNTDLKTLDTGWFAKEEPFAFERAEGVAWGDAWLESTPPVLPVCQAKAGVELVRELGVEALRAYSLLQQQTLREEFSRVSVPHHIPQDPCRFGAFTLVPHPEAAAVARRLEESGVTVDARQGNLRFCPDILNTDEQLREAARITASVLGV